MSNQQISVPGKLRRYFSMLPNLYDDSGLDPYEFRLLAHYVRRGDCWESVDTTAEHCGMSRRAAVLKRDSLARKGFIKLTRRNLTSTVDIEVIDMWDANFAKYSTAPGAGTTAPNAEAVLHQVQPKNNPENKNPVSYNSRAHPFVRSGNGTSRKREPIFKGEAFEHWKKERG